jgi:hypothetical protein
MKRSATAWVSQLVIAFIVIAGGLVWLTAVLLLAAIPCSPQAQAYAHSNAAAEGLGHVHMDISCSPGAGKQFGRVLARAPGAGIKQPGRCFFR